MEITEDNWYIGAKVIQKDNSIFNYQSYSKIGIIVEEAEPGWVVVNWGDNLPNTYKYTTNHEEGHLIFAKKKQKRKNKKTKKKKKKQINKS